MIAVSFVADYVRFSFCLGKCHSVFSKEDGTKVSTGDLYFGSTQVFKANLIPKRILKSRNL
jgi:hypothetical protein